MSLFNFSFCPPPIRRLGLGNFFREIYSYLYKCFFENGKKCYGSSILMLVIFAAFISGMIAFSLTKVINMEMLTVNQNTERILAQSLAVSEAEYIRSIKYQDLSLLVDRTFLPIRDSSYYKKYDISAEEDYTDKVKRRVVDISIYRNNIDDVPVFSIKVVRYYNGTGTTNSQI